MTFTVPHLSTSVANDTCYHHNVDNLGKTAISMAQGYVGSNNITLLVPKGQFGTRWEGGKDGASPTYISVMLSQITRVLFSEEDNILLEYLNECGREIEPTWFMPIIPTVLVNGCEGVGSGFSTYIPNYNPTDIVANIRRLLNGETMVPMDPWYKGFKGKIEKTDTNEGGCSSYTVTGDYKKVNDTHIRILELPIKLWTSQYKKFLTSSPLLQSYRFPSDVKSVNIDLFLTKENMEVAQKMGFLNAFKLTKKISTRNMHLFDEKGVHKKYTTPEQILEKFFHLRMEYYERRKINMLKNLQLEQLSGVVTGEMKIQELDNAIVELEASTASSLWLVELDSLERELGEAEEKEVKAPRKQKQSEGVAIGMSPEKKARKI
ncbi:DNA topoisomerase 2 [Cardamine amara subsp. amara]|uniref:DNA topoisomerase (ATP-hydrolyzing) n=1 Tax=Cardamine amara subsp. amara TaxID=228776 RepID=A0ABD1AL80_CARAN